jgi:hypothetical protein
MFSIDMFLVSECWCLRFVAMLSLSTWCVKQNSVPTCSKTEHLMNEGVSKSFRTESITKYKLTTINTRWEATQRVMTAKLTRLTHKIAIQLQLVAKSYTICSSHSRRPVRKLLDTKFRYIAFWAKGRFLTDTDHVVIPHRHGMAHHWFADGKTTPRFGG